MKYLLLALLLGSLLRIPGCFTQEQMKRWGLFEADEEQHMAIAVGRYNALAGPAGAIDDPFEFRNFNVQGYGRLNAYPLYLRYLITGRVPDFATIIEVNRGMSILYSLLLLVVVYLLGQMLGLRPAWAGLAAVLVAVCDLLASYAHYGLPLSGYLLSVYLSVLGGCRLLRGPDPVALGLLALGCAGALAFKFDGLVTLWAGLVLVVGVAGRRGAESRLPPYSLPVALGVGGFFLWLLTYGWSWGEIQFSFAELRRENANVVERDDHLRDNLIVYPFMVLAGIGLPAFGLAVYGSWRAFYHLGKSELQPFDEACRGTSAIEMAYGIADHWLVPTYAGQPDRWGTKPPLLIWLQATSVRVFGMTALAVRLPSALATLGLIVLLLRWSRRDWRGRRVLGRPWIYVVGLAATAGAGWLYWPGALHLMRQLAPAQRAAGGHQLRAGPAYLRSRAYVS